MKKKLLLIIGPLLLLTGCGTLKKKTPLNTTYPYEKKEAEVFTEFAEFEEDGSVRSFFANDDNEYYAQSEFENPVKSFDLGRDSHLSDTTYV